VRQRPYQFTIKYIFNSKSGGFDNAVSKGSIHWRCNQIDGKESPWDVTPAWHGSGAYHPAGVPAPG
jgi:hypothetical protein